MNFSEKSGLNSLPSFAVFGRILSLSMGISPSKARFCAGFGMEREPGGADDRCFTQLSARNAARAYFRSQLRPVRRDLSARRAGCRHAHGFGAIRAKLRLRSGAQRRRRPLRTEAALTAQL